MVAPVGLFRAAYSQRSSVVCEALATGFRRLDVPFTLVEAESYRKPVGEIAVFYGLRGRVRDVFRDYIAAGLTAVYIDLGYWDRKVPTFWTGYHKVSVNARHPTAYFRRQRHPGDRLAAFGISSSPWRKGRAILVAGMGDKAAEVEGLAPEAWERAAVARLREVTDRPIIYRPKPSFAGARPIDGTRFSDKSEPIEVVLADCHAVVTHHSNAAVDGLVAGVPAFTIEGVATPMALQDLGRIESPHYPDDRAAWLADVAYCQWSVDEMARGLPWVHLRNEGLVP